MSLCKLRLPKVECAHRLSDFRSLPGIAHAVRGIVETSAARLKTMTATIILRDQEYEIKHGMTIRSALLKLEIQPEAVIATRQGELMTDDELIEEGDEIKLVSVISGG